MTTLAQYDRARVALAEASKVEEVLSIRDEVEHLKLYARQIQDRALLAEASTFQMRVERKLGVVIAAAKEAGLLREGRPKKQNNGTSEVPLSATLAEVGIDKKLSAKAQKTASISERAFEAMVEATRNRIASGNARVIEGETLNGGRSIAPGRAEAIDSLDYFPTPPWATRALFEHVLTHLKVPHVRSAWDPACGEGHMAEAMRSYVTGPVHASDIHGYGYGEIADYLTDREAAPQVDWIVSNPPFGDKTEAFVHRALVEAGAGVAMFVRMQWLETVGRYDRLFNINPPTLIAFFAERVPLCKGRWDPEGDTLTAYVWLVWLKGRESQAPFWIPPGCRDGLTRPDDAERYTTNPVTKAVLCSEAFDPVTGELHEPAADAANK